MTAKIATSVEQSKKLAEILPLESADMYYFLDPTPVGNIYHLAVQRVDIGTKNLPQYDKGDIPCWSLNALIELLPEIKGTPLSILKSKIENKNYYNLEYEGIIMLPYCKSLVDGCVEMIIKLKELNLL